MSTRKISFSVGEYYHIYNRGNSKQKIFHNKQDYLHFIILLYICNSDTNVRIFNINRIKNGSVVDPFLYERDALLVSIGAWVLMPNHFHILITEKIEGGISKFMQKLSTAYAMYYNQKYKRTGGLFEGKFKSQHLNTDKYLKYIFSYIHLNPVKLIQKDWKEKGIRNKKVALDYLNNYNYSSFLDYLGGGRKYKNILTSEDFPNYFSNHKSFLKEIFEWLHYNNETE